MAIITARLLYGRCVNSVLFKIFPKIYEIFQTKTVVYYRKDGEDFGR